MTRKEFCEIMAAGHEEAARTMEGAARLSHDRDNKEFADMCWCTAAGQQALARAFRDLAKEQE